MFIQRSLSAVAIAAAAWSAHAGETAGPIAVTGGAIAGIRTNGVAVFKGIPFAAPPVGPLRWRLPQPVPRWKGVREAREFAPACAQTAAWITEPKSEDCLYLNVWAPEGAGRLPVIVWIHGGGYYGGSGSQPIYDGARLAKHGAVVVTLNYRLGILGFFAHPELTAESPQHAAGSQAIHDHIAALRWVRANIAKFGGDPERVAIAGESAGGASVIALTVSPLARGLFQRAIAQSGSWALPFNAAEHPAYDRRQAEDKGLATAKTLGAEHLADLRRLGVDDLHKASWWPQTVVDGYLLQDDMDTVYRARRQNDVPLLVGWNAEEGKDLAGEILGTQDFTAARHRDLVAKLLGYPPSDALLARYPGATDDEARASIYRLMNDWWGWRAVYWARLQAWHGKHEPHVYFYAHRPAPPATTCHYGCGIGHGVEIPYVFDNLDLDKRAWTPEDRRMADRLAETWVSFARTGSPNGPGLPPWPAYDGADGTILRIGDAPGHPLPDFSLFPQPPR
jgi:para-nitrobenzyl esterase